MFEHKLMGIYIISWSDFRIYDFIYDHERNQHLTVHHNQNPAPNENLRRRPVSSSTNKYQTKADQNDVSINTKTLITTTYRQARGR